MQIFRLHGAGMGRMIAAMKKDEQVLVVPRGLFDSLGAFQGLCQEAHKYVHTLLAVKNNFFMPRVDAEDDPTHKQIIPYCIFHHKGRILRYTRGKSGGEKRLVSLRSIGIGGHVNPVDAGEEHLGEETYLQGVAREIREEVSFAGSFRQRIVGLLNDDSNAVGQVHLGIVHLVDLVADEPELRSNESSISNPEFLTPDTLRATANELETWSSLCLPALDSWISAR